MNAKSMLLIFVALGCGLVAAVGVFQYLDRLPGRDGTSQMILVATKEIDIREPFTAENVEQITFPKDRIPLGAMESFEKVDGKFARTRLYPGEPVLAAKVMNDSDESGSLKVPKGYRVVAVKVDAESSVSSLIQPGDRVDVVAVLKKTSETQYAFAKTILKAVRVFAVNRDMTRDAEAGVEAKEAQTVSLLVAPEQAEKLAMANELGRLQLALRGAEDVGVDETPGATVEQILGRGDVADDLNDNGSLRLAGRTPGDEAADLSNPVWEMTILSPQGAQQFTWTKDRETPFVRSAGPESQTDDSPAKATRDETRGAKVTNTSYSPAANSATDSDGLDLDFE